MTINRKGFTLIEMLVVIAVVGILSAVVLTALGPARNKAKDTRIISALNQARAVAESIYNGDYAGFTLAQTQVAPLAADVTANGGTLVITSPTGNLVYAAYSKLASDPTSFYCVDSVGNAGVVTTVPVSGAGSCK